MFKGLSGKRSKAADNIQLFGYDDITLKLFLSISFEGSFQRLVIKGKPSEFDCLERWEEIIQRNSKENENFQYDSYVMANKSYSDLLALHSDVKLLLLKCSIVKDADVRQDCVDKLKALGYKISLDNQEAFANSIDAAQRKSNSLVTKITMKLNELNKMHPDKQNDDSDGFHEILANLEEALGGTRSLPDDITLAKFNALNKIAKKKNTKTKVK